MAEIEAIIVNHNTSEFAEAAARSLFETHDADLDLNLTICDNASTDDVAPLQAWALRRFVEFRQTGFTTDEPENSHGELLRRFTLQHPDARYLLFLDADVRFIAPNTISHLRDQLANDRSIFGVQAAIREWATEVLGVQWKPPAEVRGPTGERGVFHSRPHPCCLLVRNDAVFQRVAREIGFSCAWRFAVEVDHAGWFDTFALAAAALRTHELDYAISDHQVLHYANTIVERRSSPEFWAQKQADVLAHLDQLRRTDSPTQP